MTVEAGQSITKEGDAGSAMYIIRDGSVAVEGRNIDGKRTFSSGDSFGEEVLAGLAESYYTTTVSMTNVKLDVIEEGAFRSLFKYMPEVLRAVKANAAEVC